MQVATTIDGDNGMVVKRLSVPIGLEELMESLTKQVLLKKPKDLYAFASQHFAHLVTIREKLNSTEPTALCEGADNDNATDASPNRVFKVKSVTSGTKFNKLPKPIIITNAKATSATKGMQQPSRSRYGATHGREMSNKQQDVMVRRVSKERAKWKKQEAAPPPVVKMTPREIREAYTFRDRSRDKSRENKATMKTNAIANEVGSEQEGKKTTTAITRARRELARRGGGGGGGATIAKVVRTRSTDGISVHGKSIGDGTKVTLDKMPPIVAAGAASAAAITALATTNDNFGDSDGLAKPTLETSEQDMSDDISGSLIHDAVVVGSDTISEPTVAEEITSTVQERSSAEENQLDTIDEEIKSNMLEGRSQSNEDETIQKDSNNDVNLPESILNKNIEAKQQNEITYMDEMLATKDAKGEEDVPYTIDGQPMVVIEASDNEMCTVVDTDNVEQNVSNAIEEDATIIAPQITSTDTAQGHDVHKKDEEKGEEEKEEGVEENVTGNVATSKDGTPIEKNDLEDPDQHVNKAAENEELKPTIDLIDDNKEKETIKKDSSELQETAIVVEKLDDDGPLNLEDVTKYLNEQKGKTGDQDNNTLMEDDISAPQIIVDAAEFISTEREMYDTNLDEEDTLNVDDDSSGKRKTSAVFGNNVEETLIQPTEALAAPPNEPLAATKIQSVWRGHNVRKRYNQMRYKNDDGDQVVMQSDDVIKAVTVIQAFAKGHLVRKHIKLAEKEQKNIQETSEAAIVEVEEDENMIEALQQIEQITVPTDDVKTVVDDIPIIEIADKCNDDATDLVALTEDFVRYEIENYIPSPRNVEEEDKEETTPPPSAPDVDNKKEGRIITGAIGAVGGYMAAQMSNLKTLISSGSKTLEEAKESLSRQSMYSQQEDDEVMSQATKEDDDDADDRDNDLVDGANEEHQKEEGADEEHNSKRSKRSLGEIDVDHDDNEAEIEQVDINTKKGGISGLLSDVSKVIKEGHKELKEKIGGIAKDTKQSAENVEDAICDTTEVEESLTERIPLTDENDTAKIIVDVQDETNELNTNTKISDTAAITNGVIILADAHEENVRNTITAVEMQQDDIAEVTLIDENLTHKTEDVEESRVTVLETVQTEEQTVSLDQIDSNHEERGQDEQPEIILVDETIVENVQPGVDKFQVDSENEDARENEMTIVEKVATNDEDMHSTDSTLQVAETDVAENDHAMNTEQPEIILVEETIVENVQPGVDKFQVDTENEDARENEMTIVEKVATNEEDRHSTDSTLQAAETDIAEDDRAINTASKDHTENELENAESVSAAVDEIMANTQAEAGQKIKEISNNLENIVEDLQADMKSIQDELHIEVKPMIATVLEDDQYAETEIKERFEDIKNETQADEEINQAAIQAIDVIHAREVEQVDKISDVIEEKAEENIKVNLPADVDQRKAEEDEKELPENQEHITDPNDAKREEALNEQSANNLQNNINDIHQHEENVKCEFSTKVESDEQEHEDIEVIHPADGDQPKAEEEEKELSENQEHITDSNDAKREEALNEQSVNNLQNNINDIHQHEENVKCELVEIDEKEHGNIEVILPADVDQPKAEEEIALSENLEHITDSNDAKREEAPNEQSANLQNNINDDAEIIESEFPIHVKETTEMHMEVEGKSNENKDVESKTDDVQEIAENHRFKVDDKSEQTASNVKNLESAKVEAVESTEEILETVDSLSNNVQPKSETERVDDAVILQPYVDDTSAENLKIVLQDNVVAEDSHTTTADLEGTIERESVKDFPQDVNETIVTNDTAQTDPENPVEVESNSIAMENKTDISVLPKNESNDENVKPPEESHQLGAIAKDDVKESSMETELSAIETMEELQPDSFECIPNTSVSTAGSIEEEEPPPEMSSAPIVDDDEDDETQPQAHVDILIIDDSYSSPQGEEEDLVGEEDTVESLKLINEIKEELNNIKTIIEEEDDDVDNVNVSVDAPGGVVITEIFDDLEEASATVVKDEKEEEEEEENDNMKSMKIDKRLISNDSSTSLDSLATVILTEDLNKFKEAEQKRMNAMDEEISMSEESQLDENANSEDLVNAATKIQSTYRGFRVRNARNAISTDGDAEKTAKKKPTLGEFLKAMTKSDDDESRREPFYLHDPQNVLADDVNKSPLHSGEFHDLLPEIIPIEARERQMMHTTDTKPLPTTTHDPKGKTMVDPTATATAPGAERSAVTTPQPGDDASEIIAHHAASPPPSSSALPLPLPAHDDDVDVDDAVIAERASRTSEQVQPLQQDENEAGVERTASAGSLLAAAEQPPGDDGQEDQDKDQMDTKRINNAVVVVGGERHTESQAATKIQASFRGYQVRKQMHQKTNKTDSVDGIGTTANVVMVSPKRNARRKTSGSLAPESKKLKDNDGGGDDVDEEKSATKIQAGVRGFLVRRRNQKKKDNEEI